MIYEFQAPDGRVFEFQAKAGECPIGQVREIEGVPCVRIPSVPVPIMNDRGAGWIDIQSPRNWGKSATKDGSGFASRYTKSGQPIYGSSAECKDAIRKANDHGEKMEAVRDRDWSVE